MVDPISVGGILKFGNAGSLTADLMTQDVSSRLRMRGLLTFKTGSLEVRCLYVMGEFLYCVKGDTFVRIDPTGRYRVLGTLVTDSGPAWIQGDGQNLMVVDTAHGYTYASDADGDFSWATITTEEFPVPSSLTYQDGYFIVTEEKSGRFYISSPYDPTTWDSLDYATAEGNSDDLVCVFSHNRDLWLLGKYSTEIWYNSGAAEFPFERNPAGAIGIGCASPRSVAASAFHVFWLDNEFRVRQGTGVESQVISTRQIDYQIGQESGHSQAVGFFYVQEGHEFYQLTIGNSTWCYDTTTGFWHKRASGTSDDRHPAQCYALFNDKHLVGHFDNGKILELDLDTYTNDGEMIRAIRTAQAVVNDRKTVFHHRLEIEFEAGVGNAAETDPEAILDWSDDGGHTWSNEHTTPIGASGQYKTRAVWRRLGPSRDRAYRVTIEDPVKRVIIGAHLEADPGRF